MTSQNLIYFMLAAYIIPIAFVYYKYKLLYLYDLQCVE